MVLNNNIYWLTKKITLTFLFVMFFGAVSANEITNNIISKCVNTYTINKLLKEEAGFFSKKMTSTTTTVVDEDDQGTVFPLAINLETKSPYGPGGWPFLFLGTLLFSIMVATWYYHQLTYIERNSREFYNSLNELNSLKLKFFTTIDNDLKLPLTLILNPLEEILSTYQGDTIIKSKLRFVEQNVKHLIGVVNKFTEYKNLDINDVELPDSKSQKPNVSPISDSYIDSTFQEELVTISTVETDRKVLSILVVDNDIDSRLLIKKSFKDNYSLLETDNCKEALSIAFKKLPDLIICDFSVEEMNGIELCKQLKTNIRTSHIPFILTSSSDLIEYQIEGLKSGADFYIIKPLKVELFKVRVEKLLESRKLMKKYFHIQDHFNLKRENLTSSDDVFIDKVLKLLNANISDESYDIKELVSDMNTSRSTFYRKLKEITGQAPNDFIQMIRLNRAAELLLQNQNTISEISFMVGYKDPNYFGKCFRKMYGVAPSQYLEKHGAGLGKLVEN